MGVELEGIEEPPGGGGLRNRLQKGATDRGEQVSSLTALKLSTLRE